MKYFDPNETQAWLTGKFDPVSLEALNEKASMLSRIDNKYVVRQGALERALPDLAQKFDILDIGGRRNFSYEAHYFDDAERQAYYEHHQGRRKGFKVRVRRYVEAELCFLEVKMKGRRGMTLKFRRDHDLAALDTLSNEDREFARETYSGHYGKPFLYDIRHTLKICYRRVTLVAKDGGERMTIDSALSFHSRTNSKATSPDVFIVETKSQYGRGLADKALRNVNVRPTKRCSKYCVGMATLGEVSRYNRFIPAMKKLGLLDHAADTSMPGVLAA